jgi:hypothetical protein
MSVREVYVSKAALHILDLVGVGHFKILTWHHHHAERVFLKSGRLAFFVILAGAVLGQIDPDFDGLSCPVLA